jgi:translation elongation factor EF-4
MIKFDELNELDEELEDDEHLDALSKNLLEKIHSDIHRQQKFMVKKKQNKKKKFDD